MELAFNTRSVKRTASFASDELRSCSSTGGRKDAREREKGMKRWSQRLAWKSRGSAKLLARSRRRSFQGSKGLPHAHAACIHTISCFSCFASLASRQKDPGKTITEDDASRKSGPRHEGCLTANACQQISLLISGQHISTTHTLEAYRTSLEERENRNVNTRRGSVKSGKSCVTDHATPLLLQETQTDHSRGSSDQTLGWQERSDRCSSYDEGSLNS